MPSRPAVSAPDSDILTTMQEPWGRSVLKRALLGVVLLFALVSSGAWLLHAGIQPGADDQFIEVPVDRTS